MGSEYYLSYAGKIENGVISVSVCGKKNWFEAFKGSHDLSIQCLSRLIPPLFSFMSTHLKSNPFCASHTPLLPPCLAYMGL
jgi:hypothetical protein